MEHHDTVAGLHLSVYEGVICTHLREVINSVHVIYG